MTKDTPSALKRKIKRLESENEHLRNLLNRAYEHSGHTAYANAVKSVRIAQAIRILQGEDE